MKFKVLEGENLSALLICAVINDRILAKPLEINTARAEEKNHPEKEMRAESLTGGSFEIYYAANNKVFLNELYFRNGFVGFTDIIDQKKIAENADENDFFLGSKKSLLRHDDLVRNNRFYNMLRLLNGNTLNLSALKYNNVFEQNGDVLAQITFYVGNGKKEITDALNPNREVLERYYGSPEENNGKILFKNLESIAEFSDSTSITVLSPEYVKEKLSKAQAYSLVRFSSVGALKKGSGGDIMLAEKNMDDACYGLGIKQQMINNKSH